MKLSYVEKLLMLIIKEILLGFWNSKVRFRARDIPPLLPILRNINPIHTLIFHNRT